MRVCPGVLLSSRAGAIIGFMSLKYRLGKVTSATRMLHHLPGSTPLMAAILHASYDAAWLLITEGARLDVRNARSCSAADLAREVGVPQLIQEALDGEVVYCRV